MTIFTAQYNCDWNYGGFEECSAIVTANTASEALGFLLHEYAHTKARHWVVREYLPKVGSIVQLHSRES